VEGGRALQRHAKLCAARVYRHGFPRANARSAGQTAGIGDLSLTLDIADRVYAISTLDVSTNTAAGGAYDNYLSLLGAGVVGAESIGGVFYFTNAFDSRTEGVDLVMTYPIDWDNGSTTRLTASFNYNKSELDSDASAFLNDEDQFDFENIDPELRGIVSASHSFGDFLRFF
jgi:iron complex outermembrane receptor protein